MVVPNTAWGRLKEWGFKGFGSSFGQGVASVVGFEHVGVDGGKKAWKFLGGMKGSKAVRGFGAMALVGGISYAATDNPLLAMGAGMLAGGIGSGGVSGMLGRGMKLLGPAFVGIDMVEGFRSGGISGALGNAAKSIATWGAIQAGGKAISVAFKGTALHGFGSAALKTIKHPLALAAIAAGIGTYKAVKGLTALGRRSRENEFAGSMEAFNTQAAYTMRQRAVQEISRSHTNARTILGQEATYMHIN